MAEYGEGICKCSLVGGFFITLNSGKVFSMHKSQVFFYLLSAFILGVFTASFLNFSPSVTLALAVIGIIVIILSDFQNRHIILAGFIILAFCVGISRFSHFASMESVFNDQIGQEVSLEGYVDSEPDIEGNRARFIFRTGNEKILVTTNAFPRREFGDGLLIVGKLELPQNFALAGQADFDYVAYLRKDGIRTVLFYPVITTENINLSVGERARIAIYGNIFEVKSRFQNAINLSVPEPNASFLNGILLGTRQNIPDDLKNAFKKTGTTHILAISGYNIMIISEAVLLGLIWFFKRRVAFWISVAVIISFVILTGASASVVRAGVMGLILSFANGYGRLYDQKNSIILAGGLMIWFNPYVLVFDIGFQLSFGALLGLIYLYPWFDFKLPKISELGGLRELFLMTFSAQIAVAPLLMYYFGNLSLISLPANILILPFLPYAMLAGFLSGLTGMLFLPLGQLLGYIAWAITTYQIWVVRWLG